MAPTPIFVLGMQRSGTTWIANMLAGSGAVAAVTAVEHQGVHESIFFSHFARAFGPFSDPDARGAFRTAFLESDYFRLTGLDVAWLDETIARSNDHAAVFRALMDTVAANEGCGYWLEKSPHHTLLADEIAADFPDARFVCVTREHGSLITSRLAAYGRTPPRGLRRAADILRGTMANALYRRALERFAASTSRALLLSYDALRADPDAGRAELVAFLGLPVGGEALESAFAANTSHRDEGSRRLSGMDRLLIRVGDAIGRLLPLSLLLDVADRRRAARGLDWPDWVWTQSGYRP